VAAKDGAKMAGPVLADDSLRLPLGPIILERFVSERFIWERFIWERFIWERFIWERFSPSRGGFSAPNKGALLTAPGRSREILLR
jgi:hypothetical protein